ncbi:putative serine esterase-domain-containing protein [Hygrophoropsis aurantiaca]|uniref:Serine esterase-domain-containing protein n=1 Tax=Hygrophoropsis aurantiaca TaxID=72124 RepID=A0ACB8AND9_9AGAM|nr:putative serine esterase-domain-containing protein [Hygrophoropsis aurantiaca]
MPNVHLLVLIHGMWGNPSHLAHLDKVIREVKGGVESTGSDGVELAVLVAETNKDESTYDGIDWGGERVAEEILDEVKKFEDQGKKVIRFSVTGYSLGGLVARYVIGILHQRKFFETITPVNFNTLATPHIGIPRFASTFSSISAYLGPKLLSRSGEQFFCVDKWSPKGRPLVEVLADPERVFYQALLLFPNICIYANAIHDRTVPFVTAAISAENPFGDYEKNGIQLVMHEDYKNVIKSYTVPSTPPEVSPKESDTWLQTMRNMKPPLPPLFQRAFPLNLVVYAFLPVLFPTFLSLVLIRLSIASHKSRTRLRSLESASSNSEKLIHILAKLESEIEGAMVELYDDPQYSPTPSPPATSLDGSGDSKKELEPKKRKSRSKLPSYQPLLTPVQLSCIEKLNRIPQLKKELAFFEGVLNSHAVIVCRDIKNFKHHLEGEGVLHHWADHFEL